jgi:hypothetical protein
MRMHGWTAHEITDGVRGLERNTRGSPQDFRQGMQAKGARLAAFG